ncbi:putative sporulation protein YtxC [Virgibacillus halophilus]|uniref:Sporulation protein YtxC n=1 Tax=Tigheibacillus halophilus TaxID=361280 RepID=A0ABU5CCK7_9BACI|nr:putative sporulation protein YtxC [Virgibacillus halophilus]
MQEIYFGSNKEVISFCDYLFSHTQKMDLHWRTDEAFGNRIKVNCEPKDEEKSDVISKSLADVFIKHRLTKMTGDLITNVFYYTNHDEMEQILELTHWIFAGEDIDSRKVRQDINPKKLLQTLFVAHIQGEESIHFDSLVQFRMQEFKEQLIQIIGLAIDEFKREEEHQAFINMLREYISNKEANYRCVHILQGNHFSFFKPDGNKFTNLELKKLMHAEPLYIVGLDAHEMNLAPLVAMAPKKIYVYGDYPSEPKTLTIINVFQEKVEFLPVQQFPFPYQLHH